MSARRLICVAAVVTTAAVTGAVADSATNLAAAQANLARYDGTPAWVAPGPAFAAKKARGKMVFVIPATPQSLPLPSVGAMIGGIRQAGTAVGVKTLSCTNGGRDAAWAACFKQALAKKVNAIVLAGGTPPASMASQLAAAKTAGIVVVGAHVPAPNDFTGALASAYADAESGLTAIVPAPYAEIGKLVADGVVADRPTPAGRFVIVTSSNIVASAGLLASVQNELAAVCGADCPVETMDIPSPRWQLDAIPTAQSLTLSKATVTFIPLFDKLGALLAEGVRDARAINATVTQPRMHGYGGTPFFIQLGQDNNRVEGDVAENMNWLGWATMDQVLRVLTGTKPVASEKTGLRFVDDDAWGAEGVGLEGWSFPPLLDEGWGDPRGDDGWITGFRKLWGLPGNSDGYRLGGAAGGGDDD